MKLGFNKNMFHTYLYFKSINVIHVFLLLYVDDILLMSPNMDLISNVKKELSTEFEIKELGKASKILGTNITRDKEQ